MPASISPTLGDAQSALRSFLLSVLPAGVDVIIALPNRVPEPQSSSFVVMTPTRFERIETSVDSSADVRFTGSIAAQSSTFSGTIAAGATPGAPGVLTVSGLSGALAVGGIVAGAGVVAGTQILAQTSGGAGGPGTYLVTPSQKAAGSMTESHGLMTVTATSFGAIAVGATLFGVGLAVPTQITALGTGAGGTGTYVVSPSQTFAAGVLSSGAQSIQMNSILTTQLDFHAAGSSASDMAQAVATVFRDQFASDAFAALNPNVSPLYADDPRYMPFVNESQQSEWRWVLESAVQVNQTMSVPQQYADVVQLTLASADAFRALMDDAGVNILINDQTGQTLFADNTTTLVTG